MTITLDNEYFAVSDDSLLGHCGEKNSRPVYFTGLDSFTADRYSIIFTYPDGASYESRIENEILFPDSAVMRMPGRVMAQVIACNVNGDEYEVIKKSNVMMLEIKPSLDDKASPFPSVKDSLRLLDELETCEERLTEVSESIAQVQEELYSDQRELSRTQASLLAQFSSCVAQMNTSIEAAREYAQAAALNAQQAYYNKSSIGMQKRNLLKIDTCDTEKMGVAMTVNADGSVTFNGETGDFFPEFILTSPERYDAKKHIPNGRYILCSNGDETASAVVTGYVENEDGTHTERAYAFIDDGQDKAFTMDSEFPYNFASIMLSPHTVYNNKTIHVMLKYEGIEDSSYEPYRPSLQEQIDELRDKLTAPYNETQTNAVTDEVREEDI